MNILRGFLAVLGQLFLKNIFSEVVKCLLYVDIGFGACFQEADAMLSGNLWQKEDQISWFTTANFITKVDFKGAMLQGFRRFLAQTIPKLVVANLNHSEHYFGTSKGRYNLNSQKENKTQPLTLMS